MLVKGGGFFDIQEYVNIRCYLFVICVSWSRISYLMHESRKAICRIRKDCRKF